MNDVFTESDKTLPNGTPYHLKEGWTYTGARIYVTHESDHTKVRNAVRSALYGLSLRVSKKETGYFEGSWYELDYLTESHRKTIEYAFAALKNEASLKIKSIRLEWQTNCAIVVE